MSCTPPHSQLIDMLHCCTLTYRRESVSKEKKTLLSGKKNLSSTMPPPRSTKHNLSPTRPFTQLTYIGQTQVGS